MDKPTDRQTEAHVTWTDIQAHRHIEAMPDRHMDRLTDKHIHLIYTDLI